MQADRSEGSNVVVSVHIDAVKQEFNAEKLLVAIGRRPNTNTIAIENAGIVLSDQGQVLVDEYLKTNMPHIFAGGRRDRTGKRQSDGHPSPI
jgi:pyruvate/2-oxoglutarate dehydrogenase complex dihydrolipoamide dehydrogenase (E3) component